jgi:hypothetical protein
LDENEKSDLANITNSTVDTASNQQGNSNATNSTEGLVENNK